MNCPKCGFPTYVRDVAKSDTEIFRKRICRVCGSSVYTVERRQDDAHYDLYALRNGYESPRRKV